MFSCRYFFKKKLSQHNSFKEQKSANDTPVFGIYLKENNRSTVEQWVLFPIFSSSLITGMIVIGIKNP